MPHWEHNEWHGGYSGLQAGVVEGGAKAQWEQWVQQGGASSTSLAKARAPGQGLGSNYRRALRGHLWEEGDKEKGSWARSSHREKV